MRQVRPRLSGRQRHSGDADRRGISGALTPFVTSRLFPPQTPRLIQLTALFYLAHILCSGWVGSSQGFLALSLCAAILATLRGQFRVRYHPLYVPMALFVAASTISAAISYRPMFSLFQVSEWFTFLAFPVALTLYRTVPSTVRLTLRAFLLFGLLQSLYGLWQYFVFGHRELENRITGTAAHVQTYSGLILPISLLALLLTLHRRSLFAAICATATTLALILTFTRGAWIGWTAGAACFVALRRPRWLAWAVPVLLLLITLAPLALFGRMISTFDVQQASNRDRIYMAEAGWEMIKDYTFFGVGPSNVKEIYPLYRRAETSRFRIPHLHNNIIQIWAERGLLALFAYLLIVATFVAMCVRAGQRETESSRLFFAETGLAVTVALFFAGFFEFNFGDSEVLVLMLDLMALVAAGLELPPDSLGSK